MTDGNSVKKRDGVGVFGQGRLCVMLCGICAISFATSGYFFYRESILESRLSHLERQFAVFQTRLSPDNLLVERIRRQVDADNRRLLLHPPPLETHSRFTRDVTTECTCPPGKAQSIVF